LDAWRGSRPSLRRAELVRLGKEPGLKQDRLSGQGADRRTAGVSASAGHNETEARKSHDTGGHESPERHQGDHDPAHAEDSSASATRAHQSAKIGNPFQRLMLKTIVTEPRAIRASRIRKRLPGAARTLLAAPLRAGGATGRAGAADLGVAVSDTAFAGCAGRVRVLEELPRCSRGDLRDRGVFAQARLIFESIEHPPPPPGLPAPELVDKVAAPPNRLRARAHASKGGGMQPGLEALR